MSYCIKYSLIVLLFLSWSSFGQHKDSLAIAIQYFKINETLQYGYAKPRFTDIFRNIPKDLAEFGKFTIQKNNLKWDLFALGSTLIIISYDQKITNDAVAFGNQLGGWDKDPEYQKLGGFLNVIPRNIPSAVYYIGNGGTTLLLSGMFYVIGKSGTDDYRALTTANELIEVLLSVGITTQTIKRISGRQSPSVATKDGGEWNPFPSFTAFQDKTPNYDAMPSGHLATYMATVTVIALNYPELKWIQPIGYTIGGILAFNMASNKVHWVSDYPIAILIGYVMGKNIANRHIIKKEQPADLGYKKTKWQTHYLFNRFNNTNMIGMYITF